MTSEVVRNVVMLQCVYYASVFNDLVLYKHSLFYHQKHAEDIATENQQSDRKGNLSMRDLPAGMELPPFKVGIIGCGQVGTVVLTKLLEVRE